MSRAAFCGTVSSAPPMNPVTKLLSCCTTVCGMLQVTSIVRRSLARSKNNFESAAELPAFADVVLTQFGVMRIL